MSKAITDREPVVGDIARLQSHDNRVVGTPEQIADQLEVWQAAGVDGINVINWVIPGSFEEFADKVLPVLRERGLAQTEYAEGTLRQKLFGTDRLNERHPAAAYRGAFEIALPAWRKPELPGWRRCGACPPGSGGFLQIRSIPLKRPTGPGHRHSCR